MGSRVIKVGAEEPSVHIEATKHEQNVCRKECQQ